MPSVLARELAVDCMKRQLAAATPWEDTSAAAPDRPAAGALLLLALWSPFIFRLLILLLCPLLLPLLLERVFSVRPRWIAAAMVHAQMDPMMHTR
jgi:hypothetical protein